MLSERVQVGALKLGDKMQLNATKSLQELRVQAKLTQLEAATLYGVCERTWQNYEARPLKAPIGCYRILQEYIRKKAENVSTVSGAQSTLKVDDHK